MSDAIGDHAMGVLGAVVALHCAQGLPDLGSLIGMAFGLLVMYGSSCNLELGKAMHDD